MILDAFGKAVAQIGDPAFRRVLLRGLGLALGLLIALILVLVKLLGLVLPSAVWLPGLGEVEWVGVALTWAFVLLGLVLSVFLIAPVTVLFAGLFSDEVADAVERRHYPNDIGQAVPVMAGLRATVGLFGAVVLVNLGALILAFLLPFGLALIVWALNGWLLGREYFASVALRHLPPEVARAMARHYAGTIWLAGMLLALPLVLPFINLLVPVVGVAAFTHLFHGLRARAG